MTMRRWPSTSVSLPPNANNAAEGEQVAVDHPLRSGRGERRARVWIFGHRDRDDRLVDEQHRDGEDHRRQHEVLAAAPSSLSHVRHSTVGARSGAPVRAVRPGSARRPRTPARCGGGRRPSRRPDALRRWTSDAPRGRRSRAAGSRRREDDDGKHSASLRPAAAIPVSSGCGRFKPLRRAADSDGPWTTRTIVSSSRLRGPGGRRGANGERDGVGQDPSVEGSTATVEPHKISERVRRSGRGGQAVTAPSRKELVSAAHDTTRQLSAGASRRFGCSTASTASCWSRPLIAMVVFAIVATGVVDMLVSSTSITTLAKQRTLAEQGVSNQIEYVRSVDYPSLGTVGRQPVGDDPADAGLRRREQRDPGRAGDDDDGYLVCERRRAGLGPDGRRRETGHRHDHSDE